MKRTADILIRGNSNLFNTIRSQFEGRLDQLTLQPSGLHIVTDEEKPEYQELMSMINSEGINHSFTETREYTKQELKEAKFFHVGVLYPWEHDALKDAEHYGTKYVQDHHFEHCGKVQTSELKLDVKKIGKHHLVHIRPELIITEYAKEVIESNQLSGYEILPASDYKTRGVQKVYHLVIKSILPPFDDQVRCDPYEHYPDSDCETCSLRGFPRSEFIYREEEMERFQDFNLTFEYLDAYQNRLLIVSTKVKGIFQKHKIKLLRPEPVRFI
ncbi:hypothetical protein GC098_15730 [Paenibacillus sp. LMG 31458]|uniref:Uncharacterized protein n=1 Tax=Paenibacillus phytorum TaxID=2654977 RepID=A0ABX1XY60_9BACL|nr:hypothetical protein [Paenibacillus phytorum]NOU72856.1 hypothetical protein [Paenibacillus phytorum]